MVEKQAPDLLWWHWCRWFWCRRSFFITVSGFPLLLLFLVLVLLLLRGLITPWADQAQGPIQARRHDGNGVTAYPIGRDVFWQEVVLAD